MTDIFDPIFVICSDCVTLCGSFVFKLRHSVTICGVSITIHVFGSFESICSDFIINTELNDLRIFF